MSTAIISALVGLICTTLSSVATFLLTRRKYNTEVTSNQIKNLSDSFEMYREVTNETIQNLQKENDNLKAQVNQLQSQMINLLGSICYDAACKQRKGHWPVEKDNKNKK